MVSTKPDTNGRIPAQEHDVSIVGVLNVLLRRRWLLIVLPLLSLLAVAGARLAMPRQYATTAAFMPHQSGSTPGNLSGLAAQFGITVPGGEPGESPAFYADLIRSRAILEPLIADSYPVRTGEGEGTTTLTQLYRVRRGSPAELHEKTLGKLRDHLSVTTSRNTDVVRLSVQTPDPEVSRQVGARIIELVNRFNLETRQTQAGEERRFVETRMGEARSELRQEEQRLAAFLDRNAQFGRSPGLALEHERLQREVAWRQQVFTSLAQAYEQSRIEEVRNIPVITIIEPPTLPVRPEGRGVVRWGILALVAGLVLAVVLAFTLEFFRQSGAEEGEEYTEFARLRREALYDLQRPWRLLLPASRSR
jgi:uncharacterized protein involved in exopolysaccharide biosynthesis